MGNCRIIKLSETVNDKNLMFLGYISVYCDESEDSVVINIKPINGCTVKYKGNNKFFVDGKSIKEQSYTFGDDYDYSKECVLSSNKGGCIFIITADKITSLYVPINAKAHFYPMKAFEQSTSLTSIRINTEYVPLIEADMNGDISSLKNCTLTIFTINNGNFKQDTGLSGDANELNFNIEGNITFWALGSPGIYGTVEGILEKLWNKGKRNGTMVISAGGNPASNVKWKNKFSAYYTGVFLSTGIEVHKGEVSDKLVGRWDSINGWTYL